MQSKIMQRSASHSKEIKSMQSMLFIKPAGKPGQAWHQDEYYIPTRDASLTGVWIALDDATIENGCLWVRPGRTLYWRYVETVSPGYLSFMFVF